MSGKVVGYLACCFLLMVFVPTEFLVNTALADDSVVDQVNITVSESCSMTGVGMNSHTATITNGTYQGDIGTTTINAFCNDNSGFAIYAIGFTEDKYTGEDHTKLIGAVNNQKITTGTATSGNTSNWAMKLATDSNATYPITLDNSYGSYNQVPNTYTKVAHRDSGTDVGTNATGAELTTTYAAYMSTTQVADTYTGKVKYTLVHPSSEEPLAPQPTTAGYINYYANAPTAEGTMGRQSASDGNTVKLFASNFSRDGYGFAGWSDTFDYATNSNAHFYGPNEDIVVPEGTTANGLALYAVWIKSAGTMQDGAVSACNGLTAATYNDENDSDESTWSIIANLNSVSALTDTRDGDTYAIAKLTDNKCWMIENLRIADTHQEGANTVPTTLTVANTNNPVNDDDDTDPTVEIVHNYADGTTFTNLSPTSSVAYNATSAPDGWCTTNGAACFNQSRIRTDYTTNRVVYANTSTNMTSHEVNLYAYGNYYNWYSATAGWGNSGKSSGNTPGDLCPNGWHLPTGKGDGEYGLLSNSLGGYKDASNIAQQMSSSTTPTGAIMQERMRRFPINTVNAGRLSGASISYRGTYANYWASTASSANQAYNTNNNPSGVSPGTSTTNKYAGRTMRCLANSS